MYFSLKNQTKINNPNTHTHTNTLKIPFVFFLQETQRTLHLPGFRSFVLNLGWFRPLPLGSFGNFWRICSFHSWGLATGFRRAEAGDAAKHPRGQSPRQRIIWLQICTASKLSDSGAEAGGDAGSGMFCASMLLRVLGISPLTYGSRLRNVKNAQSDRNSSLRRHDPSSRWRTCL